MYFKLVVPWPWCRLCSVVNKPKNLEYYTTYKVVKVLVFFLNS